MEARVAILAALGVPDPYARTPRALIDERRPKHRPEKPTLLERLSAF
jgi:hypothetical protein